MRIINTPRRAIGPTTLNKLQAHAKELNLSMFDAIDTLNVSGKTKQSLLEFKQLVLAIKTHFNTFTELDGVVKYVAHQTGYIKMLEEDNDDGSKARTEYVKELNNPFVQAKFYYEPECYQLLKELLDQIALYSDLDRTTKQHAVVLSTFH